jgi:hypothetical protein
VVEPFGSLQREAKESGGSIPRLTGHHNLSQHHRAVESCTVSKRFWLWKLCKISRPACTAENSRLNAEGR